MDQHYPGSLSVASPENPGEAPGSGAMNHPQAPPAPVAFHYTQTDSFVALLHEIGASLLVSTYQANKLLARDCPPWSARSTSRWGWPWTDPGWPSAHAKRSGSCAMPPTSPHRSSRLASTMPAFCRDPVTSRAISAFTRSPGPGVSEVGSQESELWIVSTRFSCLATLSPDYSFVPRWRPPCISALAAEDRCHLNGLALVDGRPRYVTALGTTDVRDGWRADKPHGGCIIDIPSGEFVCRGLSMPHSPRWHDDRLWALESGTGSLVQVNRATGQCETVAKLPGFTRGLAIAGPYAFVGLSKIRPTSAMDGVPLAEKRDQLQCGVAVVNFLDGQLVAMLQFQTAVEEIFDVQLLPGIRFPEVFGFQKESLHHTFVIPPAGH